MYLDTSVPTLTRPRFFTGGLQFLITAALPAPIQFTKLKQSLIQLSLMINARALRPKLAENFQVVSIVTITSSSCTQTKPFLQEMKKLKLNQSSIIKLTVMTTLVFKSQAVRATSPVLVLKGLVSMMSTYLPPCGFPNR